MIRGLVLLMAMGTLAGASGCKKQQLVASKQSSLEDKLPKQAQPKLQTMKLWVGAEEMVAELALTREQQMTGMMFRTNMAENEGMLFVHPENRQAGYWMMHCPLPLSIAYISPDGVIQEIHDLKPHDTNTVASVSANIRFALETSQGWFQRHNVSTGTVVRAERGALADVFLRQ
jgi:uncharacterized protein